MTRELPMFPLGSPLLPGAGLPLQVFEPRYHALVERVLAADRQFGMVLITHGHEVGGGDQRADVGTIAEVVSHDRRQDGRRLVLAVGTSRIRVTRWLPDDPHPLAEVESWPDEAIGPDEENGSDAATVADLQASLDELVEVVGQHCDDQQRRRLVEASRLPDDDLDAATWQAALVADLGPLDRQFLLEAPGRRQRLPLLTRLLRERLDVVAFSLGEYQ